MDKIKSHDLKIKKNHLQKTVKACEKNIPFRKGKS